MSLSGEIKSYVDSNEKIQNQYEFAVLPPIEKQPPGTLEEYDDYLNYDRDELKALSSLDCAEISIRIMQYSAYLQRLVNRHKSRVQFLKARIKTLVCSKVSNYSGPWDVQYEQAINANEEAYQLNQESINIEQIIARLDHISLTFKALSDQFKNLQYAKKNNQVF